MRYGDIDWTIGADPELFIQKDGEVQSAHGLIKGDKNNPLPVDKGAVQVDGMALEFNINPVDNIEDFNNNIETVMSTLMSMVPDYELYDEVTANFSEKIFKEAPPEAKVLGCEPDYNAHSGRMNTPPNNNQSRRTAGGHVHIGGFHTDNPNSNLHMLRCQKLIKNMDYFVGMPSLFWDEDTERREMYGKAGCYRPKPYGVEYRTLSNKWIFSRELRDLVWLGTEAAIKDTLSFQGVNVIHPSYINKSKRTLCKETIKYCNNMPKEIKEFVAHA